MLINCLLSSAALVLLGVPYAARKCNRGRFWATLRPWLVASVCSLLIYAAMIGVITYLCLLAGRNKPF
nr:MAG TPA: hypothetical protein [Bacteriophage sp.]